jgi:hypothetical protein
VIGFEGKLPILATTFRRVSGFGKDSGPGHPSALPLPSNTSESRAPTTMRASTGVKSESPEDMSQTLVPGLTWADTVDLTPTDTVDLTPW